MRYFVIVLLVIFIMAGSVFSQGYFISLDHVDGFFYEDEIGDSVLFTNVPVTFHIRYTNDGPENMTGFTNGHRLYSTDGTIWEPISGVSTGAIGPSIMDGGTFIEPNSVTGSGADTLGFGGFKLFGVGMEPGFDEIVLEIRTQFADDQQGKTIVLDSSYYPPNAHWLWSGPEVKPEWSGPHTFTISDCCRHRGNMNHSTEISFLTISDISFIVDYMFHAGDDPICFEEADINNDEEVNISDLTFLIEYMFNNGPAPVPCG